MNFSTVRGYNAYAQFTAKIRESVQSREVQPEQDTPRKPDAPQKPVDTLFSDPVDIVSISRSARSRSQSVTAEREFAQTTLNKWMKESGSLGGAMTHRVSGKMMSEVLSRNGISLDENESYDINIDVWCAVTVTGKNAEKAKAIQDLLNTTPSNINWGLMLQKLPPDS